MCLQRLAAACVFLASKVEEASLRTNDMLNAVAACSGMLAAGGGAAAPAALAEFPCLVGEPYQQRKRQLILDEQLLLRRLRFDIAVDQPHRHLYVLAHCWGASSAVLRLATCILNDCICLGPVYGSASMPPATAAAAALHLAADLCQDEVQPAFWWRAIGVSDAQLAQACQAMLGVLGADSRDSGSGTDKDSGQGLAAVPTTACWQQQPEAQPQSGTLPG